MLCRATFVLAKLLHHIKLLLRDDRLMGILEDQPVIFRVIHTFLVFVGLHMSAEIHSVSAILSLFENMGNRFAAPAMRLGILMTIIPALRRA